MFRNMLCQNDLEERFKPIESCLVSAVWLWLSGSDRPESKHPGGAAHRTHRLLCRTDDGSICGRWSVR